MKRIIIIPFLFLCSFLFAQDYYGIPYGADALENAIVGDHPHWQISFMFTPARSGNITSIRVYLMYAAGGYGEGTGGKLKVSIETDDGSVYHRPSGTILATYTDNSPMSYGGSGYNPLYTFASPATVTAGTRYHIHFTNVDADPDNNWLSINTLWIDDSYGTITELLPIQDTSKFSVRRQYYSYEWAVNKREAPIFQVNYSDGSYEGQTYRWMGYNYSRTISGTNNKVRLNWTLSEPDRTVQKIWVRLKKVNGTEDLVIRWEHGDGSPVYEGTVAAASIRSNMTWVSVNVPDLDMLNGQNYHLVLSTGASTVYTTWGAQEGTYYGYSPMFTDGYFQYTTNGTTWGLDYGVAYKPEMYFETTITYYGTATVVTTFDPTSVKSISFISGGNVTDDGGGTISDRGVCWSTSVDPTIADAHTHNGTGLGSYNSIVTPLHNNTTYHVRAYATNGAGTAYGSDVTVTTSEASYLVEKGALIRLTGKNLVVTGYNPHIIIPVSSIDVFGTGSATTIATNGGTLQMLKKTLPSNAADTTATWSGTNAVGTVSGTGLVTALTNGTVTPRATANDGSAVYGEEEITVSNQVVAPPSFLTTDTYTKGWYIANPPDDITKDGSDLVALWEDHLGSGRDLAQTTTGLKPVWSATGVAFDGADDYLANASFTYSQPLYVYIVLKHISFTNNERMIWFDSDPLMYIRQATGITGADLQSLSNGTLSPDLASSEVGKLGIIRLFFNGVNGKLQWDLHTAVTGDLGNGGMEILLVGYDYANIEIQELIIRNHADDGTTETAIYNYLHDKYSIVD